MRGDNNRRAVDDYLHRYDLGRFAQRAWSELSDGYLMRFELVRALIASPKLLVVDEPLANLDIDTRANFLYELTELTRTFSNPMCILLSTHHLNEAELIADDLIVLEGGKCVFIGEKSKLRDLTKGSVFCVLGNLSVEDVAPLKLPGLTKVVSTLGGVLLYFDESLTIQDLMSRWQNLQNLQISSVVDLSGSTRMMMSDGDVTMTVP